MNYLVKGPWNQGSNSRIPPPYKIVIHQRFCQGGLAEHVMYLSRFAELKLHFPRGVVPTYSLC